jgi:hypothetical protein
MYNTFVKSTSARKVRFCHKFHDVRVPHRETICRIVNKLRQVITGYKNLILMSGAY